MPNTLQNILRNWPKAGIATSKWLAGHGAGPQWVRQYVQAGHIEPIGEAAFKRPDKKITWWGAVHTLQQQLGFKLHIASKTALELHGYHLHLKFRDGNSASLLSQETKTFPKWFRNYPWDRTTDFHRLQLFPNDFQEGLVEHRAFGFTLLISSPERAAIELCTLIRDESSFIQAKELLEFLSNIKSEKVCELLLACRLIKTRRIFLFLSKLLGHPWARALDPLDFDLGKGSRQVMLGGVFDSEYQITVPKSLLQEKGR